MSDETPARLGRHAAVEPGETTPSVPAVGPPTFASRILVGCGRPTPSR